jgi:hypothetical protein
LLEDHAEVEFADPFRRFERRVEVEPVSGRVVGVYTETAEGVPV